MSDLPPPDLTNVPPAATVGTPPDNSDLLGDAAPAAESAPVAPPQRVRYQACTGQEIKRMLKAREAGLKTIDGFNTREEVDAFLAANGIAD